MIYSKTILVAPLNWGLGHATRCIPIIHELIRKKHNVILASDGIALYLLQKEFPNLTSVILPSYNITYPKDNRFTPHILKSIPGIWKAIQQEKKLLSELIKTYSIDLVISDNRYGLYNPQLKSIIITHQIRILAPVLSNITTFIHAFFLNQFKEIWIPDFSEQNNLSGILSHSKSHLPKSKFIGILSRFSCNLKSVLPLLNIQTPFILAVISGPEPQRTLFEKLLLKQFSQINQTVIIVGGHPDSKIIPSPKNIIHFPLLTSSHLKWLLENAQICISRSGYSSIMDFVALKRTAILIPTPGQVEQEYLAEYLDRKQLFIRVQQSEFNIKKALIQHSLFKPDFSIFPEIETNQLQQVLNNI
jgi:uncharacterized protein (TIGR00661 family)